MIFLAQLLNLAVVSSGKPITIVHVVADDLGRQDLGYFNGGKTVSPNINKHINEGVFLTQYHSYKVCSPSRAAIMTGRYPWAIGYYDMQGKEAVPLNYTMLPAVLAEEGWSTHAIGKWNLGNMVRRYTPTFRGFSTFFGYYAAALGDYWYHGDPSKCPFSKNATKTYITDLSNSSGADLVEGIRPADSPGVNGTYDQELFTAEAVRLIENHGGITGENDQNLYIYLAYQNVHTTAQNKATPSGAQPLHAPCKTVDELYTDTASDTFKVMGAMVTELDYGIGNVTAALEAAGRDWVMILVSDNGGPINIASANAPLRGGKHTMWDGGLKVVSFVSGPLVPQKVRGTLWDGLACHADWLPTIAAGIANISLPSAVVHYPRPMDGHNLWGAITSGTASPRTEIVHQVTYHQRRDLQFYFGRFADNLKMNLEIRWKHLIDY